MFLNKKNNVKLKIMNVLSSAWTLLIVDNHKLLWEDFSNNEQKSYTLTLIKYNWTIPVQIEIVKVKWKSWSNLLIERAVEPCPLNYNASEMSQSSYEFSVWDFDYMNLTASEINKICEELNKKINSDDTSITKQGNSFNWWNQLLKLDWNWKVPENNLPPMNINIKWLPTQTLDWNSYIVANSWWDNYKWNLHDIFNRLYEAEEVIKVKMQIKLLASKDFKITEWRTIYISEINDYNEKDWYLWRWKVLVYRYNYWSTTEKSMIHNLNIKNRNEALNKLYESNYIDNWRVVFNKESPDSNWNALDRDQDARFNLEIYKLW